MEPREEMGSPLELDAEELMTSGETPFSFFDDPEEKLPPKGLRPRAVEIWNPMRPKSSLPPPNETVIREAEEIEYDIAEGYMPAVLPSRRIEARIQRNSRHTSICTACNIANTARIFALFTPFIDRVDPLASLSYQSEASGEEAGVRQLSDYKELWNAAACMIG
ncbi:hypothetical protein TrVFT333_009658 [Trichoderma virens FT-333]|nr:hypothetical protein TrVFT333_009658 [Trichoderma virens FT-333]